MHPAQVYSAVNAGLLAWVLVAFYPFRRSDGEVTALMLTLYPISRFLLEMIRTDESAVFGTGLSISQNISVVLLVAALVFWVTLRRNEPAAGGVLRIRLDRVGILVLWRTGSRRGQLLAETRTARRNS